MRNTRLTIAALGLVLLVTFAACTDKGHNTGNGTTASDSIANAKADSVENADLHDVLNAVKK